MSSLAPGKQLEAKCTRCRDVTGHVIVVMLEGKVAKVECKACGSVHKYYPPDSKGKEKADRPLRVKSGKERGDIVLEEARKPARAKAEPKPKAPTKAQLQTAKARAELEQQWESAIARSPGKPVPYAMSGSFPLGSLVDHPKFGVGMVVNLTPPDKMEILFQEGIKALRCAC